MLTKRKKNPPKVPGADKYKSTGGERQAASKDSRISVTPSHHPRLGLITFLKQFLDLREILSTSPHISSFTKLFECTNFPHFRRNLGDPRCSVQAQKCIWVTVTRLSTHEPARLTNHKPKREPQPCILRFSETLQPSQSTVVHAKIPTPRGTNHFSPLKSPQMTIIFAWGSPGFAQD